MTLDQAFDAGLLIDEAGRPIVSRKQLADAKWITVHPNGAGTKGTPVQISENGTVLAGMGGKFNGKKLGAVSGSKSMSLEQFLASHGVSTHPPTEPALHHNRNKSEKRHQEALTRLSKAQDVWSAKKKELTALYKSKLKSGEITTPDEVERLKRKAEAIPESESGQAAARLAAKIEARRLARSGGSAASQHIEKTLSVSAERIRQSVPSKLKETPEQRQTIEHYVAKHQAAERAILEKFHRERENNPGWSVTGRSGRKISNTATPLENLARESKTLKSIESEMVTKLESMRPASSVTASEHTKLSNNVTRSVVGLFSGTHSKSEASAAIKALATANPSKLSERLMDIEKSLKSRGSSLESLFGKSGASASLIKRHLNGSAK